MTTPNNTGNQTENTVSGRGASVRSTLWLQYSYDDIDNATVMQSADTEKEALEDDLNKGCPWYEYDIIPNDDTVSEGELTNPSGPFFFK